MRLAKVIGTVVATRKEESMIGFKLLVIEEIDPRTEEPRENCLVAVDTLGAGEGRHRVVGAGRRGARHQRRASQSAAGRRHCGHY
jgi:ethanolamine utilization protein EutN